jgi:hypothetical protein
MNKQQKARLIETTAYLSRWYHMFFRVEQKDGYLFLFGRDDWCNHHFVAMIGVRGGLKVLHKENVELN